MIGCANPRRFCSTRTEFSSFQSESVTATPAFQPDGTARAGTQGSLVVLGQVVVHDHVDAVDVEAAGGDIGRDERLDLAAREVGERLLTRSLPEVAVDRTALDLLALEIAHQAVGAALGAHEDERALVLARDGRRDLHLVHLVHEQERVVHLVDGHVVGHDLVLDRIVQVTLHQPVDRAVERRGEEHRLRLGFDLVEQLLHLRQEAHVDHAVGLVEHEHLDLLQDHLAPLHQVDEAAGSADHDVDAALQRGSDGPWRRRRTRRRRCGRAPWPAARAPRSPGWRARGSEGG